MQDIKFESDFTQKDFKKISFFNVFGRKPIMPFLCILIFVMGIVAVIPNNPLGLSPIFGLIFVLYPIGIVVWAEMRIRKSIKARKIPLSEPQKVIITESTIVLTKGGVRTNYSWDQVTDVYESKGYFVIYTAERRMIALPKRDSNSDEQFALRNMVINKLSYKHYRLQK